MLSLLKNKKNIVIKRLGDGTHSKIEEAINLSSLEVTAVDIRVSQLCDNEILHVFNELKNESIFENKKIIILTDFHTSKHMIEMIEQKFDFENSDLCFINILVENEFDSLSENFSIDYFGETIIEDWNTINPYKE